MMQIVQSLESISVNTDDIDIFHYLKELITKNFSRVLGRKDKIFSFFEENEIPQRKYFLKLLEKKYHDKNSKDIQNLSEAYHKTFRLNFKQENTLRAIIEIEVKFVGTSLVFVFKNKEKLFVSYIKQYFKEHNTRYDDDKKMLFIDYKDENTFNLFESFACVSEHLKYCVDFIINSDEYQNFKQTAHKKEANKWKFNALAKLFSTYFQVLDCKPSDDLSKIRQQYLIMVKMYHPDFHQGASVEQRMYCREQFEKIQIAYDNLKSLYKNNG